MNTKFLSGKKAEGDAAVAEAQKCLQTGLFKWKPDFAGAAKHFTNAAIAYKNAKEPELAMKAYINTAKTQLQSEFGTTYAAGKNYELAGNCALEQKKYEQAFSLFDTAADFFKQGGEFEKAGEIYVNSAKAIQAIDPKKSIKQLQQSIVYFEAEEKELLAIDHYYLLVSLFLEVEEYPSAIEVLLNLNDIYMKAKQPANAFKNCLYILIINLHCGEINEFETNLNLFLNKYQGFHTSDEFSLASSLGTVIRTDKATYTNFIKTQIHNIRDACFARLVKNMKLIPKGSSDALDEILNQPRQEPIVPKADIIIEGDDFL